MEPQITLASQKLHVCLLLWISTFAIAFTLIFRNPDSVSTAVILKWLHEFLKVGWNHDYINHFYGKSVAGYHGTIICRHFVHPEIHCYDVFQSPERPNVLKGFAHQQSLYTKNFVGDATECGHSVLLRLSAQSPELFGYHDLIQLS
ncbi:Hypothetical_protein [Hexamita inflata]|uniref:Hypothetical_protein n=1 Tax=Hexamita inflata TaxID=28002 RepID=A0AA86Q8Y6_9EUKA|nr:Hypothetical protein HINF_LOCUS35590 [Hexamita inflata]CAI9947949.1 Hypothetical protein HINF_LOCUS35594 [Hexamita inflata]